MRAFIRNLRLFFLTLSVGQRVTVTTVVAGGVMLLLGLAYWASRPEYALLFGGLTQSDAGLVVEQLRDDDVTYRLRENGSAIYVPRSQVYDLRLAMASQGIGASSPAGYELFDAGTLGMTDFMQKLNLKRALEGELSRTIGSLAQVDVSRVHLVLPDRSPFQSAQALPSASVVVGLKQGTRLTPAQIEGITGLVSGAVERLEPQRVTILDSRGNMLSNPEAGNTDLMLSGNRLKLTRSVEEHLTQKGQTMLDRFLGPQNAVVRVSASLDFDRTVSESDLIDPESATVISEEKLDEEGEGANANSSIRNFEISRTRERHETGGGSIQSLSVAVILNQKHEATDGEDAPPARIEYDESEISQIEGLVKNAVGFEAERGDQFAIHQTRFDTSFEDSADDELSVAQRDQLIQMSLRYGVIFVSVLLAFILFRSLIKKVEILGETAGGLLAEKSTNERHELPPAAVESLESGQAPAGQLASRAAQPVTVQALAPHDLYMSKLSPDAQAKLQAKNLLVEDIISQIKDSPDQAAHTIRSWLTEDAKPTA